MGIKEKGEEMKLIAISDIVDVKYYKSEVDPCWTWQDEKRFLGIKTKEAGFSFGLFLDVETKDVIERRYHRVIKNKIVWTEPSVDLDLSNGMTHHFYFETDKEEEDFANILKHAEEGQWLDYDTKTIGKIDLKIYLGENE